MKTLLSWLYGAIVYLRNKLYDWNLLHSESFDIPLLCVGNITAGGTGKTPHTEYIARLLTAEGYHIAILSRGYKRHTRGFRLASEHDTARTIGDEPIQMWRNLNEQVPVAVDADRRRGIKHLRRQHPNLDAILLDDAFQHRRVRAGLNILLIDYNRLITKDRLLPAGLLRESPAGKERANIVIITKCPREARPINLRIITTELNLRPHQALFFSRFEYGNPIPLSPPQPPKGGDVSLTNGGVTHSSSPSLVGRGLGGEAWGASLLLIAGIAQPQPLIDYLKTKTQNLRTLLFADHHDFTDRDIEKIKRAFADIKSEHKIIITTEKDATRLQSNPAAEPLLCKTCALPVRIQIIDEKETMFNQKIIDYVRKSKTNR